MKRIFFIGDIVGRPGRQVVVEQLSAFRESEQPDLVIANGENAAGGSGITGAIAGELLDAGIDGITLGDHVWDQRGWAEEIDRMERVCKPANLPETTPGRPYLILDDGSGYRLAVCTLLGRQFMKVEASNPFTCADRLIADLEEQGVDAILVEIHAETTSEKIAMGWHLDGRVAAVLGTHTHIPTADATILPGGTAYLTDAGMSGPYASVLGRDTRAVIARFLDGMPRRFEVASGDVRLCGVIVDINTDTGRAESVRPVRLDRKPVDQSREIRKK